MRQIRLSRLFLQCASCRFSALYFIPFCGGLAAAGELHLANALLGAAFWLLLTLAIEVTNRLADRVEDSVNRPERTRLCASVGWQRLERAEQLLWSLVVASAAAWVALDPSLLLAGLIVLGAAAGGAYSRGPRLARQRLVVFVILGGTFVGPFALGWVTAFPGPDLGLLGGFAPLFTVMTLFIASHAGIKDVTDRVGDEAIGYRSAFLQLAERNGTAVLALVVATPYAGLALFAAAGTLPARMLALLALLPLSIALALAVRGAGSDARSQLTVREGLYAFWLAFASAALLTRFPGLPLLAATAAGWAWWLVASRHLHWSDALRLADLRRIAQLARAGRTGRVLAPQIAPTGEPPAWATN